MQSNFSVVQKLITRELTGFLFQRNSTGKMGRIYDKCPEHLQISLRNIISQRNLLLGHVIIGFSRDGKYILSYQCRIIDDMEDGCPYLGYKYSLNWWEFHFKMPSNKAHVVPLFVGEDICHELHLLICQPPSGKHIIVHGSSSSLRTSVTYTASSRSAQSSTCYLTLAPSPLQTKNQKGTKPTNTHKLRSFALHLKYELVPPHPPFFPSVNLKFEDTILINSGDLICALTAYRAEESDEESIETSCGLLGRLNCVSDCFCGFLATQRHLRCLSKSRGMPCRCPVSMNTGAESELDEDMKDSATLQSAKREERPNVNRSYEALGNANTNSDKNNVDDANQQDSPTQARLTEQSFEAHTSCYLSVYSQHSPAANENPNSPFDCTSTAFPVVVSNDQGVVVPHIASHRCSIEDQTSSQLREAIEDAEVIVKQVVFDAEQFLDYKLRSMECIKDRFVSLKDYDIQLVQVCTWSKEVVILIKVLIQLNGKLGESSSSPRLSTYMTGFLLSWNIQTGRISVLEEQPMFEFQKQKCKSRSICHGLEQAVEIRRKNFLPTNFQASVLSFSNHTVFSGKSMKYLLHPFQPLAIVM